MPIVPNSTRAFAPPNNVGVAGGFTGLVGNMIPIATTGAPNRVQVIKWIADDAHSQELVVSLLWSAHVACQYLIEWGAEGAAFSETFSGVLGAFAAPLQTTVPIRGAWLRVTAINVTSDAAGAGFVAAFASTGRVENAIIPSFQGDVAAPGGQVVVPRVGGAIPASAKRFRIIRSGNVPFRIDVPSVAPFAGTNVDILTVGAGTEMEWLDCTWIDSFTITNLDAGPNAATFTVLFELGT